MEGSLKGKSSSLSNVVSRVRLCSSILPDYDYLFKVLMIGDSGTGKSSLLLRFCEDFYSEHFISTIGVDFKIKTLEFEEKLVKLQVWDSAGQERFRSLTSTYYRGANAIIIVYDICNRTSFVNIGSWLAEIDKNASENICVMLVGNKCDKNEREVDYEPAKAFADRLGFMFIESSAKSDINVQEIFEVLVLELKKKLVKETGLSRLNNARESEYSFTTVSEMCKIKARSSSCCSSSWYS